MMDKGRSSVEHQPSLSIAEIGRLRYLPPSAVFEEPCHPGSRGLDVDASRAELTNGRGINAQCENNYER